MIFQAMLRKATNFDLFFLSLFTVLITFQPYFLYGEINLFEFGIYLPNINAILDGLVPYRDFFHLRGPLELYVPAFFMSLFGENLAVLETYFYIGTVITLIIGIFIAKELYQTRFVLYLMTLILITRTFPRAVFNNWGGMRFGLGLLAILFIVYAFKQQKRAMYFLSGIITSLALFTSIEIGISAAISIVLTFICVYFLKYFNKTETINSICIYFLGIAGIVLPYTLYLIVTNSLGSYLDMTYSVVTNMTKVFPDYFFEDHPRSFLDALLGLNPFSRHFQHLTPAYCYIFFMLFIIFEKRKSQMKNILPGMIAVAFYGFIMYIGAFRKIGAAQFEMALQPEKILLFFMLEHAFFYFRSLRKNYLTLQSRNYLDRAKIFGISFLIFAFFMSTVGYSIARFNHRFIAYKYVKAKMTGKDVKDLIPLAREESEKLTIKRLAGLVVPSWQAQEIKQLTEFIEENTKPDEPVFMFPEQGAYSFIIDRPFVGRFPMVSFSWIGSGWHEELMEDLKKTSPRFVILPKEKDATFEKVYFKIQQNKDHYNEVMSYINEGYLHVFSTGSLFIYQRK